jgi:hypothetical protein
MSTCHFFQPANEETLRSMLVWIEATGANQGLVNRLTEWRCEARVTDWQSSFNHAKRTLLERVVNDLLILLGRKGARRVHENATFTQERGGRDDELLLHDS